MKVLVARSRRSRSVAAHPIVLLFALALAAVVTSVTSRVITVVPCPDRTG
jgi:hypothetical protein